MKYWLLACLFFSKALLAEYRVYQYYVKSKNLTMQIGSGDAQLLLTTLDPSAMIAYHGGPSAVDVTLQRTWMCPGYTGNKKTYCSPAGEDEAP